MTTELVTTRGGLPAIWESGGGWTNSGWAQVVCGPSGEPLPPIYVRQRGHLANGDHVLFAAREGMVLVVADQHRGDFEIKLWRIENILPPELNLDTDQPTADCRLIAEYALGEWHPPLPQEFTWAVQAAKEKATCYHCRGGHYFCTDISNQGRCNRWK